MKKTQQIYLNVYQFITDCKCDNQGSSQNICDPRGQCYCHVGFDGRRCNHCVVGYYGFPACKREYSATPFERPPLLQSKSGLSRGVASRQG